MMPLKIITKTVIDSILLLGILLADVVILNPEILHVAVAFLGAISGTIVLIYFRRENTRKEAVFKAITTAIGGIIAGAMLEKYLGITSPEYVLGIYFFTSLLCLFFYKALVWIAETNAGSFIALILSRALNLTITQNKVEVTKTEVTEIKTTKEMEK